MSTELRELADCDTASVVDRLLDDTRYLASAKVVGDRIEATLVEGAEPADLCGDLPAWVSGSVEEWKRQLATTPDGRIELRLDERWAPVALGDDYPLAD